MATLLAAIIQPALRKAGITRLPGNTPSTDQSAELLPACNRILAGFSINGFSIFATTVAEYSLTAGQVMYTIGPGGDFNAVRPLAIKNANLVQPGSPPVYTSIPIFDSRDWSYQSVTEMSGSWVYALWYNPTFPSTGSLVDGCGQIWLLGQPPSTYELQLFTWDRFETNFTAITNNFLFPPGYEEHFVNLLALEASMLYPHESKISPETRRAMERSRYEIQVLNSTLPRQWNDAARMGQPSVPYPASWWNAN